jgi:hypothetical protein
MKSKVLLVAVCVTLGLVFVAPHSVLSDFYVIPVVKGNVGPPAPIPKTWQTTSYATGDDGDLQMGMSWPTPRFIDNGDGTVTDKLTDLIWLKDANCTSFFSGDGTGSNPRNWSDALTAANSLAMGYCGLSDGSISGDWRLPNVRELHSLIHYGIVWPAVPNTAGTGQWSEGDPFIGVQSEYYWSSTTYADFTSNAWSVNMGNCYVYYIYNKDYPSLYVWPVRADN